jgi:cytochrome oxidase Cu insertion factor (SCO1/SenC/PrrC family)
MRRFVVILLLTSLCWLGNSQSASAEFEEAGVEKFRAAVDAPDFTLKETGGEKLSLKEFRGKVVLLNFFSPF